LFDSTAPTTESKTTTTAGNPNYKNGLYRPFAEHAWSKLISLNSDATLEDDHLVVPADLRHNVAPAKGFPEGSTVSMETRAIKSSSNSSLFRYARFALLETNVAVPSVNNTTANEPAAAAAKPIGIQVLNFVIVPHHSHLPVWGVDLVSLPGDRHLMLMDAQPVQQPESRILTEEYYKVWHDRHCLQKTHIFPWGGDIPPEAAQFVSQTALWTRLQGQSSDQVRAIVQGDLWLAFCEHLDLYLQLLQQHQQQQAGLLSIPQEKEDDDNKKGNDSADAINPFEAYLQYRLANDPARPMLRALYGPEWTERVLHEVLFPKL
jgi:phycoerythrobilin:ferredoxin oxidoreductase